MWNGKETILMSHLAGVITRYVAGQIAEFNTLAHHIYRGSYILYNYTVLCS